MFCNHTYTVKKTLDLGKRRNKASSTSLLSSPFFKETSRWTNPTRNPLLRTDSPCYRLLPQFRYRGNLSPSTTVLNHCVNQHLNSYRSWMCLWIRFMSFSSDFSSLFSDFWSTSLCVFADLSLIISFFYFASLISNRNRISEILVTQLLLLHLLLMFDFKVDG